MRIIWNFTGLLISGGLNKGRIPRLTSYELVQNKRNKCYSYSLILKERSLDNMTEEISAYLFFVLCSSYLYAIISLNFKGL